MNYQKIHNQIIDRARTRVLKGYKERHHIVPRCLGGTNDDSNLIDLTAREHFVVHRLLSKMYGGKLKYAFSMMCLTRSNSSRYNQTDYKVSSRDYSEAKKSLSILCIGKKVKESTKRKISMATKGKKKSKVTIEKMRKPKTDKHRKNISKSKIGKLNPMYGVPSPQTGRPHTEEIKNRISERTKKATEYPPCPHCGKKTTKGNALRWHYDNCKFKVNNDSI